VSSISIALLAVGRASADHQIAIQGALFRVGGRVDWQPGD